MCQLSSGGTKVLQLLINMCSQLLDFVCLLSLSWPTILSFLFVWRKTYARSVIDHCQQNLCNKISWMISLPRNQFQNPSEERTTSYQINMKFRYKMPNFRGKIGGLLKGINSGHTSFTALPRSAKFNTDVDINTRHNTNRKTKYKMFH